MVNFYGPQPKIGSFDPCLANERGWNHPKLQAPLSRRPSVISFQYQLFHHTPPGTQRLGSRVGRLTGHGSYAAEFPVGIFRVSKPVRSRGLELRIFRCHLVQYPLEGRVRPSVPSRVGWVMEVTPANARSRWGEPDLVWQRDGPLDGVCPSSRAARALHPQGTR